MAIILGSNILNDILNGGATADQIFGLGGNDTMHGAAGNDLLDGGAGSDHMGGGLGNDSYRVDSAGDFVHESAGQGIDTVESSISYTLASNFENLTLTGAANLNATGNTLNNYIVGNSGNNRIDGGGGSDHMHGEGGNDTYVVNSSGDVVHEFLNEGIDTVQSSISYTLGAHLENLTLTGASAINGTGNELNNSINGNSANNVLRGMAGNDTIHGYAGNDTLDGGTGDDHMGGGLGNDTYYVDSVSDFVHESLNQGTDTVYSRASSFTLGSNVENLTLQDASFSIGPGGLIQITPGGVDGTGNSGANVMRGNAGANTLDGLGGNDSLYGNAGNDTLNGGSGNDYLNGGTGNDTMIGSTGNDTYIVDSSGDVVSETSIFGGTDWVYSSVTHTLGANVENLVLTGTSAINGYGNALNNSLYGNGAGNYLNGGTGADMMRGGAGNDRYVVDNAGDSVVEFAGGGTDRVYASISHTLTANVENLSLTGTAANGSGNSAANSISGNASANTLRGLAGNDTIYGYGGNDVIQGGAGADTIRGGTGNDVLRAVDNVFFANDFAEDRFVFDTALNAATNVDLIDKANFTQGGNEGFDDEIVLENSIFTNLQSVFGTNTGQLGAGFYFEGLSSGNGLFDPVGIYNNTATGQLFYNASFGVAGDSSLFAAVNLAGVAGGSAVLSAEEFTLV